MLKLTQTCIILGKWPYLCLPKPNPTDSCTDIANTVSTIISGHLDFISMVVLTLVRAEVLDFFTKSVSCFLLLSGSYSKLMTDEWFLKRGVSKIHDLWHKIIWLLINMVEQFSFWLLFIVDDLGQSAAFKVSTLCDMSNVVIDKKFQKPSSVSYYVYFFPSNWYSSKFIEKKKNPFHFQLHTCFYSWILQWS